MPCEPPREDGWYRLTADGWVQVPDEDAEAEVAAGAWDLVRIQTVTMEEATLW